MEYIHRNCKKDETRLFINSLLIIIYISFFVVICLFFYDSNVEYDFGIRGYVVLNLLYIGILLVFLKLFEGLKIGNKRISDILLSNVLSLFLTNIVVYFIFGLIEGHLVAVLPFAILQFLECVVSLIYSYFGNKIIRYSFPSKKTIVFLDKKQQDVVKKILKYQPYEFNIVKTENEKNIIKYLYAKKIKEYEAVITIRIDSTLKEKLVNQCYEFGIQVYDVPSITDVLIKSSNVTNFIDTPIYALNKFGPNVFEKFVKRVFDLCISIIALVITSPILFVCALIIKIQDGGSILFRQKRLTKDGEEFELIKFRSMVMNAEPEGKALKTTKNDLRITKFGKFMRSTRIDELPQLFNIIKGDLSLVGPRALRVEEYDENRNDFPEFFNRLKVKAGLTGYAQVYGKYNTSFNDKLLMDIYYIENFSCILDIKLLLTTLIVLLKKDSTEGF